MKTQALKNEFWIGLILAAMVTGTGVAYWFKVSDRSTVSNPTISNPAPEIRVAAYWIEAQSKKFVAVPIPVKTNEQQTAITFALSNVIKAETTSTNLTNLYSAIPTNTKVLDCSVKDQDIYLNLSQNFTEGGGSASIRGRVIQVLYTATSLNPNANLFLSVEGKPLRYLGGEGLELSQPLRRSDFALEF